MRYLYILAIVLITFATTAFSQQTFKVSAPREAELHTSAIADLRAAYQLLNISLEIIPLPAKRALLEAEKGTIFDAELARIKDAEGLLSNFIRIPVILRAISSVAITSKNTPPLIVNDLTQYRIASIRGILATNALLENIDNVLVDSIKQGIDMLFYKRIDAFIVLDFMTRGLEHKIKDQGYMIQTTQLSTSNFYHYLHKKHSAIVPALSLALSKTTGNPVELKNSENIAE